MPIASDSRKRVNNLSSVVKKAECVSTLRNTIGKYTAVLETEKEAEQYKHVTPGGWESVQAAVEKAQGYVAEHLEGKKPDAEPVPLKKFPEFQGNITSTTETLVKACDAVLFPPKTAAAPPPAVAADGKEAEKGDLEKKEGDAKESAEDKAADMDLD